jgi:hypothetical protein
VSTLPCVSGVLKGPYLIRIPLFEQTQNQGVEIDVVRGRDAGSDKPIGAIPNAPRKPHGLHRPSTIGGRSEPAEDQNSSDGNPANTDADALRPPNRQFDRPVEPPLVGPLVPQLTRVSERDVIHMSEYADDLMQQTRSLEIVPKVGFDPRTIRRRGRRVEYHYPERPGRTSACKLCGLTFHRLCSHRLPSGSDSLHLAMR